MKIGASSSYYDNRLFFGDATYAWIGEYGDDDRLSLHGAELSIDIDGSTGTAGQVLTADGTGLASWEAAGSGSMPAGTSGQTLRHNGTTWLSNSVLYNNGTNVGIGTTTPNSLLHVNNSTGTAKVQISSDATSLAEVTFFNGTTYAGAVGVNNTDDYLYLYHGGNMVLKNGSVGIGTATPSGLLHIAKSTTATDLVVGDEIGGSVSRTDVTIGNTSNNSLIYMGQSFSNKAFFIWNYSATPADAVFEIGTYGGNNNMALQSAGGFVGIGTTTPTAQLHTTGTVKLEGAGTPGVGKVLTSDATGNASWEAPSNAGTIADAKYSAGFCNQPSAVSTTAWSGPKVSFTITSTTQKVILTASVTMGANATAATGLNIYPAYSASPTGTPTTVGLGSWGFACPANSRSSYSTSAVISGLAPGVYYFGAAVNVSSLNWTNNEWGYVTATLVN